jgi:hypothetical protein
MPQKTQLSSRLRHDRAHVMVDHSRQSGGREGTLGPTSGPGSAADTSPSFYVLRRSSVFQESRKYRAYFAVLVLIFSPPSATIRLKCRHMPSMALPSGKPT